MAFTDFEGVADLGATGTIALGLVAALALDGDTGWTGLFAEGGRDDLVLLKTGEFELLTVFLTGDGGEGFVLAGTLPVTFTLLAAAFLAVTTLVTRDLVTDFADWISWLTTTTFFLPLVAGDLVAATEVLRGAATRPLLVGAVAALFLLVTILIVAYNYRSDSDAKPNPWAYPGGLPPQILEP
jgi:hypothetical protein